MEVDDILHVFEPVLVEVQKGKVKGFLYDVKNGKGPKLSYPFHLSPYQRQAYFEIKSPFNPISYLKSPMGIMVAISGFMYFMMKKMPKPDKEMMGDMNKSMSGMGKMPSWLSPS